MADDVITRTFGGVRSHIAAARGRDPATANVSSLEILLTWPGVQALLAYRLANRLRRSGIPLLPYAVSYLSRMVTGIEIHPDAKIGPGLFIDHGSGVVIGETAEIGENVTLYQGVTLGGTGFQAGKRHPTIEDNVTIGSGAKLLGPIKVGHGAKIGANSVVVEDVPPRSTVVGNPGHPVRIEGRKVTDGPDADWIHLPDPLQDAVKSLSARIKDLERQVAELSGEPKPDASEPEDEPKKGRSSAGG
ncbi:MAG TPA: serine O-acetyltransferase [Solirubrobacterales bacterium]|nr:serine O-acetyltransferase [Solirubrobacterales bacterium]